MWCRNLKRTFSLLCFSSLLTLSDGAMSPTIDSAMSWTRASLIHLKNKHWHFFLIPNVLEGFNQIHNPQSEHAQCKTQPTCLCPRPGRWWSRTWRPCDTCGQKHSRVPSPSGKPSRSAEPSVRQHQLYHEEKHSPK